MADFGIVDSCQYQESGIANYEVIRARLLIIGKKEPVTGFETHFLKCWNDEAMPACKKEEMLMLAVWEKIKDDEMWEGITEADMHSPSDDDDAYEPFEDPYFGMNKKEYEQILHNREAYKKAPIWIVEYHKKSR
jgi:hypothetical protein